MQVSVKDNTEEHTLNEPLEAAQRFMAAGEYGATVSILAPFIKQMDQSKPTSEDIDAVLMMAQAQGLKKLFDEAYHNYAIAIQLAADQRERIEPEILKCLPYVKTLSNDAQFEAHLQTYLGTPGFDNHKIEAHIVTILLERYDLKNDTAEIDFSAILSDRFLIHAISALVLSDVDVAKFLNQIRSEIFRLALENGIPSIMGPMVIAFAEHAALVGYEIEHSEDDQVLLLGVNTVMESHASSSKDLRELLEPLMLYLMYKPITSLAIDHQSFQDLDQQCPEPIRALFSKILLQDA